MPETLSSRNVIMAVAHVTISIPPRVMHQDGDLLSFAVAILLYYPTPDFSSLPQVSPSCSSSFAGNHGIP